MLTGKVVLIGAVALGLVALAMGSAGASPNPAPRKLPPPGDNPPAPIPIPPPPAPAQEPPPDLTGMSTADLAVAAGQDVDAYGWNSKRGVVAAFQKSWNANEANPAVTSPPEAKLTVDDKWGPLTYTAALRTGASGLPPAYNPAPKG